MNNEIQVSITGKIVISGEYAVLDGAPAIVSTLKQKVNITIQKSDKKHNVYTTSVLEGVSHSPRMTMPMFFGSKLTQGYSVCCFSMLLRFSNPSSRKIFGSLLTAPNFSEIQKMGQPLNWA